MLTKIENQYNIWYLIVSDFVRSRFPDQNNSDALNYNYKKLMGGVNILFSVFY